MEIRFDVATMDTHILCSEAEAQLLTPDELGQSRPLRGKSGLISFTVITVGPMVRTPALEVGENLDDPREPSLRAYLSPAGHREFIERKRVGTRIPGGSKVNLFIGDSWEKVIALMES